MPRTRLRRQFIRSGLRASSIQIEQFCSIGFALTSPILINAEQRSEEAQEGDERCYSPPSLAQISFACLGSAVISMTFI